MEKTFSMSMYANAEDLYKAKAEHYQSQSEALMAQVEMLRGELESAGHLIAEWGGYAETYFKEKHDLHGDITHVFSVANKAPQQSLDSLKSRVEEETIERCVASMDNELKPVLAGCEQAYYCDDINSLLIRHMPRKYKEDR